MGKKRLYAAPPAPSPSNSNRMVGSGIDLGNSNNKVEQEPKEVFGAVRRNPNAHEHARPQHDEFGIIHKILSGSSNPEEGKG